MVKDYNDFSNNYAQLYNVINTDLICVHTALEKSTNTRVVVFAHEIVRNNNKIENYMDMLYKYGSLQDPLLSNVVIYGDYYLKEEEGENAYYAVYKDGWVAHTNRLVTLSSELTERHSRNMHYTATEVVAWSIKMFTALESLHQAGILHKNINTQSFHIRLNDLVLGQYGVGFETQPRDDLLQMKDYFAPEILDGQDFTKSGDVYSMAVVFLEIITLQPVRNTKHLKEDIDSVYGTNNVAFNNLVLLLLSVLSADSEQRCSAKYIFESILSASKSSSTLTASYSNPKISPRRTTTRPVRSPPLSDNDDPVNVEVVDRFILPPPPMVRSVSASDIPIQAKNTEAAIHVTPLRFPSILKEREIKDCEIKIPPVQHVKPLCEKKEASHYDSDSDDDYDTEDQLISRRDDMVIEEPLSNTTIIVCSVLTFGVFAIIYFGCYRNRSTPSPFIYDDQSEDV
ncbi:serine/threonine-protein kinase Nek2 [Acrasis kona]|uniref:Serine/threonine-protein kinase Nek2 n=1 Tax=Acrasis kona TaxID=1008807 RepID=A0AAW2ZF09_9EUKA